MQVEAGGHLCSAVPRVERELKPDPGEEQQPPSSLSNSSVESVHAGRL